MSTSASVLPAATADGDARARKQATAPGVAFVRDFVPPPAVPRVSSVEEEAYDRGLADGERRALELHEAAASARIARLSAAIADVAALRPTVFKQAERDIVMVAVELARRIVRREIGVNPELLLDLGRQAASKLAGAGVATIEMAPDVFAAVARSASAFETGPVEVLENRQLLPGACQVRSSAGIVNISLDAQIQECLDALFTGDGAR
jgi:flagellar assembly protein FliH